MQTGFLFCVPDALRNIRNRWAIDLQGYTGNVNAEVYDVTGRVVMTYTLAGNSANTINIETLAPGSYIVKVLQEDKQVYTKQIIKQ